MGFVSPWGWEEGEGRKNGREGRIGKFCVCKARVAPRRELGGETRGGRGETKGQEGRETFIVVLSLLCLFHYIYNGRISPSLNPAKIFQSIFR